MQSVKIPCSNQHLQYILLIVSRYKIVDLKFRVPNLVNYLYIFVFLL